MHLWIGQIFMANFLRRIRQNKTAMHNFLLLLCITQSSDLPVSMKTELLSEESCIYYQRHQISGIHGPLHAPFFPFTAARYYFCRQLLGPIWTCDIHSLKSHTTCPWEVIQPAKDLSVYKKVEQCCLTIHVSLIHPDTIPWVQWLKKDNSLLLLIKIMWIDLK